MATGRKTSQRAQRTKKANGEASNAPHGSRPEQVYTRLRDLIVQGLLSPGSRIIETEIASRLGVSRTPVREALQRLQQEGFVTGNPAAQQSRLLRRWIAGDETFLLESLERFANRRPTHSEPRRDFRLDDPAARREKTLDDQVAQPRVDLLRTRAVRGI